MAQGTQSLLDRIPDEDTHDLLSRIPDEAEASSGPTPEHEGGKLRTFGHTSLEGFLKLPQALHRGYEGLPKDQLRAPEGASALIRALPQYRQPTEETKPHEVAQRLLPITQKEEESPTGVAGSVAGGLAQIPMMGPAAPLLAPAAFGGETTMDTYDAVKAKGGSEEDAWKAAIPQGILSAATTALLPKVVSKLNVNTGGWLAKAAKSAGAFTVFGQLDQTLSNLIRKHTNQPDIELLTGLKGRAATDAATGLVLHALFPEAPRRPATEAALREIKPAEASPQEGPAPVELPRGEPSPASAQATPEDLLGRLPAEAAPRGTPPEPPPEPEHPAVAQLAELKDIGGKMDALETRSKWLRQRGRGGEALPLDQQRMSLLMRQQELALEIQTGVAQRAAAEAQTGQPEAPTEQPTLSEREAAAKAPAGRERTAVETAGFSGLTAEEKAAAHAEAPETTEQFEKRAAEKFPESSPELASYRLAREEGVSTKKYELNLSFDDLLEQTKRQNPGISDEEAVRRTAADQVKTSNEFLDRAEQVEQERAEERRQKLGYGPEGEERRVGEERRAGEPVTQLAAPTEEKKESPERTVAVQAIRNIIEPPRPPRPPIDEASMPSGPDRNWHPIYDKWEQDDATDRFMTNQNAANLREELKATLPQDFASRQRAKMLAPGERPLDMLEKGMFLTVDAGDKFDEAFGRTQDRLSAYEKAKLKAMANATPEQRAIAEKIRARSLWFGENVAVEAGIIKEAHDNYLHRIYEGGEGEQRPRGSAKFKTFSTASLPRTYETVLDALAAGKKLKIESAINAQQQLENEILQVKRDRNLIKGGRKAGIFRFTETDPEEVERAKETGQDPEKYKLIENPRFKDWKTVAKVDLAEADPETLQRNLSNATGEDVPKDEAIKIYGWSKQMLRENPKGGETESLGVVGKDVMIRADGTIMMKRPLYAPADMADKVNLRLKTHQYMQGPWGTIGRNVDIAQNAVKSGLLKAPVVHYTKVTLDFMLGADMDLKDLSPKTAYKRGWQSMADQESNLRMGVAGGLKLDPGSEWADAIHQRQTWIGNGLDKLASQSAISMAARNWLKNTLQDQVDFLFHRYIPALKARAFLTGLDNDMVRNADRIASGQVSRSEVIAARARNANTLLGDLNLQRLGRDPTTQRWASRVLFAPTWAESGWRKAREAFESGAVGEANRQMWKNFAKRYAAVWVGGNLAAALMEDPKHPGDQALKNLQHQYGVGLRALLGVDITPELALLGRKNPNRFYLGIMGSFADAAKIGAAGVGSLGAVGVPIPEGMKKEALQLFEDKMNVVGRAATMAMTGMDYRGRTVTSLYESTGIDDKGNYKTTAYGKHMAGQPKGGKLAGEWTSYQSGEKPGPISAEQYPSFAAYQLEHSLPIHVQGLVDSVSGQMDWWHAIAQSIGMQPQEETDAQRKRAQ